MQKLTLNLTKPGEGAPKLSLNLTKNEKFKVMLGWEGPFDLDSHALVCVNTGSGAKLTSLEQILSTYNVKRVLHGQTTGILDRKSDGSFEILGGALVHSPDVTDGDSADVDEFIFIDPAKLQIPAGGALEIPIVAMIHPQSAGQTFRNVKNAWMSVVNSDNVEVMKATLSDQFGEFVGVQMGSIMIDSTGTHFAQVGVGFNCDFNGVIEAFVGE